MPIFGTLAGLTAAGLYAVVDEIRVAHKVRSHQISGRLQAWDYKVNDDRFDGIIRRFENDWELDGGSLYPEKLIGFFAENPDARKQWVRMQASILLHDAGMRRSCETDTIQFGDESVTYETEFGCAERKYVFEHYPKSKCLILQAEEEQRQIVQREEKANKRRIKIRWVMLIIGVVLIICGFIAMKPVIMSGGSEIMFWAPLSIGVWMSCFVVIDFCSDNVWKAILYSIGIVILLLVFGRARLCG